MMSKRSRIARTVATIGVITLLVAGCGDSGADQPIGVITPVTLEVGKAAPDFTLAGPDGESVSLSDFRGKFVYIDFWASWCQPCLRALPGLKRIWSEFESEEFIILGVSQDHVERDWTSFLNSEPDIGWAHVYDSRGSVADLYGVRGIPHTFLVDPDGIVLESKIGGTGETQLREDLDSLLAP